MGKLNLKIENFNRKSHYSLKFLVKFTTKKIYLRTYQSMNHWSRMKKFPKKKGYITLSNNTE